MQKAPTLQFTVAHYKQKLFILPKIL